VNYKYNKEEIIKKGVELFWSKGYHNLGVDEICRTTGMTKGAFYNSFKSKEQFLLTTIENYGNFIGEHLQSLLNDNTLKPFERLLHMYKTMLEAQTKNRHMGCFVNNTMSELGSLNANVASSTSEQFNKFLNAIEPTVREAQRNQELIEGIDSMVLTKIIHTTFFGVLTTTKSSKTPGYPIMETLMHSLKK